MNHGGIVTVAFTGACLQLFDIGATPVTFEFACVKGKGLDTCYSATYMSQTRDQQRFRPTTSEVAADWHQPMVP